MKIQIEAEIYDDPDFCGKTGNNKRCKRALEFYGNWACTVFSIGKLHKLHTRMMSIEKHPQCKEEWKKAKEKEKLYSDNWIKPQE